MNSQDTLIETQPESYARTNDLKAFDARKTGVKGLVDEGTKKIPSIFVRPHEDRLLDLSKCPKDISVPIIDLAHVDHESSRTIEIAKDLVSASKKWGFFQVVNHGIPFEVLDMMIEGARMFHEQDDECKKQFYSRDKSKVVTFNSNYDFYKSNAANWRDSLSVNTTFTGEVDPQELPPICKDVTLEYVDHMVKLVNNILMLLSMGLGLRPKHLEELDISKGWSLACHYYPTCPEPQLTLGTGGHADITFITILLQDQVGGLQVLHENQWVNVEPITGALIVNIGDALQIVSNDLLKSVYHRSTVNNVVPRISVPFFVQGRFSSKKIYGPIKELISEENPPLYREFSSEENLTRLFSNSLDDIGIHHFKLHS
ncbi:deacetoxyvindoline 4-hydroxylase-like isoform X1 [Chenopodium quinoa]|uniref:deacetoxyvindoline 4-hydroxylase-like isoform X1 n=1 Tax=Chenopodium quinoa TaxID=63459 RepID=UPI000B798A35|nr:deacetoxyvindoline 4-hydroxylase-like isoform X1 [Chenopodium quinoa]